jgi:hypothetical protein
MTSPAPFALGDRVRITCAACGHLPWSRIGTTARVVKLGRADSGVWIAARGLKRLSWVPAAVAAACLERIR